MAVRNLMRNVLVLLLLLLAAAAAQKKPNDAPAVSADDVVGFLDQSVEWYRQATRAPSNLAQPGDRLLLESNRQLAAQYLQLAFDYARVQAQTLDTNKPAAEQPPSGRQQLRQALQRSTEQLERLHDELDKLEENVNAASARQKRVLLAQREEIKSEIAFVDARVETLNSFVNYVNTTERNSTGNLSLSARVEQIARTVPELQSLRSAETSGQQTQAAAAASASTSNAQLPESTSSSSGLVSTIVSDLAVRREINALRDQLDATANLRSTVDRFIAPLRSSMQAMVARGNDISNAAAPNDVAALQQQKQELDSLAAQFKQISAVLTPLGKAGVTLDTYNANVDQWRKQLQSRASRQTMDLALRIAALLAIIALLFGISEAWRRATFHYVHDKRRRDQILLVRRIVITMVLVVLIAITLIAQASAFATYAGLVTAGLAVALQNIILSLIAYFFLIGRYGLHVGDRVTISGVTGDVLEIGLLRLHMLELLGEGADVHRTGRVVVFSNSVILQPNSYLLKQAPSTDYVWHELKLTAEAGTDYRNIEDKVRGAVEKTYAAMEGQDEKAPRPLVRLLLGETGLKLVVRYPVDIRKQQNVDEMVTSAVLNVIQSEPRVALTKEGKITPQA
jgi:small-conductance mechanosensitive channel